MLIGLCDVSIRLHATLFCLRTAALYQHCAHVRRLYATHQLMPSSEWRQAAMCRFGGIQVQQEAIWTPHMNCILRICLEQLVAPDKCRNGKNDKQKVSKVNHSLASLIIK